MHRSFKGDVSEENIASIYKVNKQIKAEPSMKQIAPTAEMPASSRIRILFTSRP
jgi:hypothetical protein